MTRRKIVILLTVLVLFLVGGGAAGFVSFTQLRGRGALERAEAAYAAGNWSQAKQQFQWYLARHPEDLEALKKYAEAARQLTDNRRAAVRDTANAYFRLASETKPRDTEAARRCLEYARQHELWPQLEYAAGFFEKRDPGNAEYLFARALAQDRLGRVNDAIEGYRGLIEKDAAPWEAYGNLALLLRAQGQSAQAEELLKAAVEKYPKTAELLVQQGRYLLLSGKTEDAGTIAEEAVGLDPDNAEVQLLLGQVKAQRQDWDGVLEAGRRVMEKDPARVDAYLMMAGAHQQKGDMAAAEATLSQIAPEVLADHPPLYIALAELQIQGEAYDRAAETVAAYRKTYPDHTAIFDYLEGRKLLRQNKLQEAIDKLKIVTVSSPDFLPAQFNLAMAYLTRGDEAKGDLDLAKSTLEVYVRNNPADERAAQILSAVRAGGLTFDESSSMAHAAWTDPNASVDTLLTAARQLILVRDSARRGEALELAEKVLSRALERAPDSVDAARALAGVLIERDRFAEAKAVLEKARAAGAPGEGLVQTELALALAQKDIARALQLKTEYLNREGATPSDAIRWSDMFAAQGFVREGIELLDEAGAKAKESERPALLAQKVALCVRAGDLAGAQEMLGSIGGGADAAQAKLAVAESLMRGRRLDEAGTLVAEVQAAEPGNESAKLLRARLHLMREPAELDQAEAIVNAMGAEATSPAWLLVKAEIAGRRGNWSKSAELAERATEGAPSDLQARMALAEAQWRTQRLSEAQAVLEGVLSEQPNHLGAIDLLCKVYAGRGQSGQARGMLARLEAAAEQYPELRPSVESTAAWLAFYDKRWKDAEPLFRKQVEARADDVASLQALAVCLAGLERRSEAETMLREAADRLGDSPQIWNAMGQFYLTAKEPGALSKASSAFTRALSRQKDYTPALLGLLEVQVRQGNAGAASALCDRFLAERPDDADVLYQKARILAAAPGKGGEALEAVKRACAVSERPEFVLLRALLYLDTAQYAASLEDLRRLRETQGTGSAELDAAMAEAYWGLGSKESDPTRKAEFEKLAKDFYGLAKEKSAEQAGVEPPRVNPQRMARLKDLFEPGDAG